MRFAALGDGLMFLGRDKDLRAMAEKMKQWYEIKVRSWAGPDPEDLNESWILNRARQGDRGGVGIAGGFEGVGSLTSP